MQSLNIGITGASGFVGSSLLDMLLPLGHNLSVLTRNRNAVFPVGVKVVCGDLTSKDGFLRDFLVDCDVLYHCAAEIYDDALMQGTHVEGTKNLIQAIADLQPTSKKIIHWIQLSSVGVYGPQVEGAIIEGSKCNPVNEYERTKLMSDKLVTEAASLSLINASILRPTNIYGPKMKNKSLFSLIKMIHYGLFFYINKSAYTNYIHVKNVCHALCLLAKRSNFRGTRLYILGDCIPIAMFVDVICKALGRRKKFIEIPKVLSFIMYFTVCKIPKFPLSQARLRALKSEAIYNGSFIERDIGYTPIITATCGLNEMVEHYLKNQNE